MIIIYKCALYIFEKIVPIEFLFTFMVQNIKEILGEVIGLFLAKKFLDNMSNVHLRIYAQERHLLDESFIILTGNTERQKQ